MKLGRGIVALALVCAAALLAPAGAGAVDSDLKHTAVFRLEASNGFSILAIVASQRADGRGQAGLIVYKKQASVTYGFPATITATRIDADLGRLGRIALDVSPSGREKTLRSRCGEEPESFTYEPQAYRGTFEFRGEEGYATASTSTPSEYARFFVDLFCGSVGSGEIGGADFPGARLRLHADRGSFHLNFKTNKNRPGKRVRFEVETHERRRGIPISRSRTLWVGSGAFEYDPLLRTAKLAPPTPFSGHAGFRRSAAAAKRWTGNLTVDMPGRSDVPLTGAGVEATLSHACFRQGEDRFRC